MSARLTILFLSAIVVSSLFALFGINSDKSASVPVRPKAQTTTHIGSNSRPVSLQPMVQDTSSRDTEIALVTRVVDGDTFIIDSGQSVRMIGINTPELHLQNGRPAECFAENATARTRELIENKTVKLEIDISETDKYNRLLRYVYVDDVFVNKTLAQEGFARVRAYPPDVKHHEILLEAMRNSKASKNGLWGECE